MHAIELRGLRKVFGKNVVLDNVDLKLSRGRFHALLGHNGAGKSTLMKILMRYEPGDSGEGSVLGVSLNEDTSELNLRVAFVTEALTFSVDTDIKNFFKFYASLFPRWDETLFQKNVDEMRLDLNKPFSQLSRGQRMQIAFAAALASRPELFLLDEITSVLDAHARTYFMKELHSFTRAGGTVLMATNMVSEVHEIADDLTLLEAGKIRLSAPISEIRNLFVKIRDATHSVHPVFRERDCVEIGINSDQSVSYIISAETAARHKLPTELLDHRVVTPQDAFIYYTNNRKA